MKKIFIKTFLEKYVDFMKTNYKFSNTLVCQNRNIYKWTIILVTHTVFQRTLVFVTTKSQVTGTIKTSIDFLITFDNDRNTHVSRKKFLHKERTRDVIHLRSRHTPIFHFAALPQQIFEI